MSTPFNRTIKAIVIHHPGDGKPPSVSILNRWNPYKYEYPEYDYGVESDGTVRIGRPLNIQGSHCIATKGSYGQRGSQWWNQNSIGIAVAGDFTKFPMPPAQFNGLVALVKSLMSQYGLQTLDNVYPHCQVASTACPGCTYSKVAGSRGFWSYDEFEKAVMKKDVNAMPTTVTTPQPVKGPIAPNDIYLSVRVLDNLADQAIVDIHKLGFACQRLDLA